MGDEFLDGDRPANPDPEVLEAAATSLNSMAGRSADDRVTWDVLQRFERPRSTLFHLLAHVGNESPGAFYKVSKSPPYVGERRSRWEETVRAGLARSMDLERRLADLLEGEGTLFSRALATQPDSMTVVTIAVPGNPLGRLRGRAVMRQSARLMDVMARVGGAARLIEACTSDLVESVDSSASSAIERRLGRVRGLPASTLKRLEEVMHGLTEEMSKSPQSMAYAHGDLSSSNILVDRENVGIIDFTWPPRPRGFDLAHFAFRIEYDTPSPASFTASLREALITGYGDTDVVDQPGYRFVRLSKLLKVIEGGTGPRGRMGGRRKRAWTEIQTYL